MGGKVGVLLAQTRLCPERLASGGVSQLGRRQGLPVVVVAQDGKDIPAARRSRVGICGTGGPRPGFISATIAKITAGMATGPTKQLGTTFLARSAGASSLAAMVTPTRLGPAASRPTDLGSMTRSEMSLNGPRIAGTAATRARPQTVRLGRAVTVISASNAAVPGAILRTISARRSAAGNPTGTVMSMPAYGLSERSPNEVEIARARRCSEGVDVINWYPAGRGGATGLASKGACVWSWLDHSAYVGICSAYETKSCRFPSWWPDTAESA
jgi:hypothetical protein